MRHIAPGSIWPLGRFFALGISLLTLAPAIAAQVPTGQQFPTQLPNQQQAKDLLRNQPALIERLRERIGASGLTPDQVRSRLRAAGYPEGMLDDYIAGADTTKPAQFGPRTLDAVRALGVVSAEEADSLARGDSLLAVSDSLRQLLDSLRLVRADSIRTDSLSDSLRALTRGGLKVFGLETFRRTTTRFQATMAGPVDENYRLGPGDELVLILTGDVEQAYSIEVTREGFVVIPQVGQVYAANLTIGQFEDQLYTRLGKVYSGVRRSPSARTKFQISLARLRNIQVYVAGNVVRPGAYQISAAGTALTALYAAGGPTANGSFRQLTVRRGDKLVDSLDLYRYMVHGINPTNIRLDNGDVIFVPVHSSMVKVAGKVVRPAIYETKPGETLRDVVGFAGGLDPTASEARVQIHRVLPPESRGAGGRARVVIAVGADQFAGGVVPAVPLAPGDSVTALSVPGRQRGYVTVKGNVWVEGQVGFTPGMRLGDAIRLAGGPRPDVYLPRVLVTRVREDSESPAVRASLADSTGKVQDDIVLEDEDEIRLFSRTTFRPAPSIADRGRRAPARPGALSRRHDGARCHPPRGRTHRKMPGSRSKWRGSPPPAHGSAGADDASAARLVLSLRESRGRGGAQRPGHTVAGLRQRAGAAAGRLGPPAYRGDRGPGEGAGTVHPSQQDRATERDARAGRRIDRRGVRGRHPVLPGVRREPAHRHRPTAVHPRAEVPARQHRGPADRGAGGDRSAEGAERPQAPRQYHPRQRRLDLHP